MKRLLSRFGHWMASVSLLAMPLRGCPEEPPGADGGALDGGVDGPAGVDDGGGETQGMPEAAPGSDGAGAEGGQSADGASDAVGDQTVTPPADGSGDATIEAADATPQGADATSGTDAAIDAGGDAAVCTLPTVSSSTFVPLSGSARLSGTEELATGQVNNGCMALVTNPTRGVLTFSLTATGCSFSYADGNGTTYSSTVTSSGAASSMSFNGDTYTCAYSPQLGAANATLADFNKACPELGMVSNGINGGLTLTVTRSTGAVSLRRVCLYQDAVCQNGGYLQPTSEFVLSGSLTCGSIPDASADSGDGS